MQFINTRPVERAQTLTQCLRQAGIDVVELPLLELVARPFSMQLQGLYSQLFDTQVIVVVSPTAVQFGMKYLQESGIKLSQLQHIKWVAVGQTTAQLLQTYGCESLVPEVETSEGMLSLAIFNNNKNLKKIAFWRGEGGRQFMMQQCALDQLEVLNFVLYERQLPQQTFTEYQRFMHYYQHNQTYINCISSEASWLNWLLLNQQNFELINQCHYLVLGERLYQILQEYKKKNAMCFNISILESLKASTVLQHVTELQRNV